MLFTVYSPHSVMTFYILIAEDFENKNLSFIKHFFSLVV